MEAGTLSRVMGGTLPLARYAQLTPAFNRALILSGCLTGLRSAMFCAQIGHESEGLLYMEEIASGAAYQGRVDLWNTNPGDGVRYKGRGPIQVTGRKNYTLLSKWAFENKYVNSETFFLDYPNRLALDKYAFLGAIWFWTTENLNSYADRRDILGATRRINGGTNGYLNRLARWNRALQMMPLLEPSVEAVIDDESWLGDNWSFWPEGFDF